MLTSLFNLPTAGANSSSGLKAERSGFSASAGTSSKTAAGAAADDSDNFSATLKKAWQRRQQPNKPEGRLQNRQSKSHGAGGVNKGQTSTCHQTQRTDNAPKSSAVNPHKAQRSTDVDGAAGKGGQAAVSRTDVRDAEAAGKGGTGEILENKTDAVDPFSGFDVLLNILAALGFTVSEDGRLLPPGEGNLPNITGMQPQPALDPQALNRLLAGLEKAGLMSSAEIEAAWQRVQQLFSGLSADQLPLADRDNLTPGKGADTAKPLAALQALIKEMLVQAENQRADVTSRTGGDVEAERSIAKPARDTTSGNGTVTSTSGRSSSLFSQDVELRTGSEKANLAQPPEKDAGIRPVNSTPGGESTKPVFTVTDSMAGKDGEAAGDNPGSKPALPAGRMTTATVAANDVQSSAGSPSAEQAAGRISGPDGSAAATGTQNPAHQGLEKSAELPKIQESPEAGRSSLRSSAMEQIVKKAVFFLKNGQTEAKIDLKPEYLGHIRMQVITEQQQVTIRIHAQLQFVKEMIENNLHQLKVDLQQQGLNADRLEVSVSNDSRGQEQTRENAGWMNSGRRDDQQPAVDTDMNETHLKTAPAQVLRVAGRAVNIDYFV